MATLQELLSQKEAIEREIELTKKRDRAEAIARVRNEQFIELCEQLGDNGTARLYRDVIQPEEIHHHELGRKVLERLCTTPELQRLATQAARNTLAIADELSTLAERSTGMHSIPVS